MFQPVFPTAMRCIILAAALLLGLAASPLLAQNNGVQNNGTPAEAGQSVSVSIGRSQLIRAPWPVNRVSVAEPAIADLQVVSPTEVLVMGKTVGSTDLILWSEDGQSLQMSVRVDANLAEFKEDLRTLFPTADLDVSYRQGAVVVRGTLRRLDEVAQLNDFLEMTEVKYLNLTTVAGVQQVLLNVRVAEASRTAVRAMGVNFFHAGDDFFGGSLVGGNANAINIGAPEGAGVGSVPFSFNADTAMGSAVTLFGGFPSADLQIFIEALTENQYMRTLAEPNLVALSGETASFLAGGEFPIPVVQGTGGGTSLTVEYKEFGVRLSFLPTVLGDGSIRLHVAPEVSDITNVGAVVIEGFSIPAIATRRAQTTLEMKSGQTFAMAGLLNHTVRSRAEKVPALGELPILGALFRSVRYEQGDTELIVLVTATLVEPMSPAGALPVPGEAHRTPSNWELFVDGRLESDVPPKVAPADAQWLKEVGLDRLQGPGAWVSYGDRSVPTRPEPRPRPAATEDEASQPSEASEDASAQE
jgi:pilus assembly protein CpaC